MSMASGTGHAIETFPFTAAGSLDMKSTATCPGGRPLGGTGAQLVSGAPATGIRPYLVTSCEVPANEAVSCAAFPQPLVTNTAQQGGRIFGVNDGVACTKSHPMAP